MRVVITISDGYSEAQREYRGDYHELHSNDWDKSIRDLLDLANELKEI